MCRFVNALSIFLFVILSEHFYNKIPCFGLHCFIVWLFNSLFTTKKNKKNKNLKIPICKLEETKCYIITSFERTRLLRRRSESVTGIALCTLKAYKEINWIYFFHLCLWRKNLIAGGGIKFLQYFFFNFFSCMRFASYFPTFRCKPTRAECRLEISRSIKYLWIPISFWSIYNLTDLFQVYLNIVIIFS